MSARQAGRAGDGRPSPAVPWDAGLPARPSRSGRLRLPPALVVADVFDLPEWNVPDSTDSAWEALRRLMPGDEPLPMPLLEGGAAWVCAWDGSEGYDGRGCGECDLCRELGAALAHLRFHREASQMMERHWWGPRAEEEICVALGEEGVAILSPEIGAFPALEAALGTAASHLAVVRRITHCLAVVYEIETDALVVCLVGQAYVEAWRGDDTAARALFELAGAVGLFRVPPVAAELAAAVACRLAAASATGGDPADALQLLDLLPRACRDRALESRDRVALLKGQLQRRLGDDEQALLTLLGHLANHAEDREARSDSADPRVSVLLDAAAQAAVAVETAAGGQLSLLDPAAGMPDETVERRAGAADVLRRELLYLVERGGDREVSMPPQDLQDPLLSFPCQDCQVRPAAVVASGAGAADGTAAPWSAWRRVLGEAMALRVLAQAVRRYLSRREMSVAEAAPGDNRVYWSPRPILAFRQWTFGPWGLHGAYGKRWKASRMEADCVHRSGNRRAGNLGWCWCGIYGYSDVQALTFPEGSEAAILGLAEFTGRVIEHERGYRAQHARVVAVAAWIGEHIVLSSDPAWIESLFQAPVSTLARCVGAGEPVSPTPLRIRGAAPRAEVVREYLSRSRQEVMARYD